MKRIIVALLLLAGVAAAVWGTVLMLRPQMDERLYAHYRKFPAITVPDSAAEPIRLAAASFQQKNYTRTIALLDTLQQLPPQGLWMAALSHLELEQYPPAAQKMALLNDHQLPPDDELIWFNALRCLRQHDRKTCRQWLTKIQSNNFHYPAAIELLKKIE